MENIGCDSWTELFSIVTATVPEICSDDPNKPMQELDIIMCLNRINILADGRSPPPSPPKKGSEKGKTNKSKEKATT